MAYYRTGTVSVNNSTSVTGSGTAWVANVRAGDAFVCNGVVYEISAVNSDTSLTLSTTFSGSVSGAAYMVMPVQGYQKTLADQVSTLLTSYGSLYNSGNDALSIKETTYKNWSTNPPGTAASPAIRRAATDTSTGIYWPANYQLDISANGTRSASFTSTGINNTAVGATTPSTGAFTTLSTTGQLTVGGNLVVNGTTTTVNSTTTTLDDPLITLGGDTAPTTDDNKDRGVEYRWHNGTSAKVGFFGYDDSAAAFTFVPDATNASEVISGTAGPVIFGAGTFTTGTFSGLITANGGLTAFDNSFSLKDNTDATKIVTFDVGTLVPTATTVTVKTPAASGTMALAGTANTESPTNASLGTAAYLDANNIVLTNTPSTVTAATYTVSASDIWLIFNTTATCTVTLPSASLWPGRIIVMKTIAAFAINSASSNVAPIGSGTAGTAILAAAAGKWVRLVSDGANWVAMESN